MVSVSFLELALCVGTAALADQLATHSIVQQRVDIRRDVVLAVEGSADRPHLAVSERGCIAFAGDRFVSGLLIHPHGQRFSVAPFSAGQFEASAGGKR
jgi:hypothetical protein